MKLEMMIKKVLIALVGDFILGIGVGMISQALLGCDPAVSFSQAACIKLNISLGQMVTITNGVLLIITFFVKRNNIGLATLFVVLLNRYPVDLITNLITYQDNLFINIGWVLLGIVCISIGCNIIMCSKLGMGIYDAFISSFSSRFNKSYIFIRFIVDSIFLLLTLLLNGYIGIGTILSYLLIGNIIKITRPYIEHILVKE